jgi:AcrR family transcriptional regulator
VVEAALAVVDEVGIEGMTIRRVAEQAGAPPMSLYTHFSNKNELLDLMYSEITSRMYRDQGYENWQTELLALCARIRTLLLEHPNWAPLLSRPVPPLAISLRERVLKLMMADGATSDEGLRALFRFGFLIFEIGGGRYGMMRVVDLRDEVGNRELELERVRPRDRRCVGQERRMLRREKIQDRGRL